MSGPRPVHRPSDKPIHDWLERIKAYGRGLTVWEDEFIERIDAKLARHLNLTNKEIEKLEQIYTERT